MKYQLDAILLGPQGNQRRFAGVEMPSVSQAEQIATAIAEHDPQKLYKRNRSLLRMTHQQLHDFAATPRKGLPVKKEPKNE